MDSGKNKAKINKLNKQEQELQQKQSGKAQLTELKEFQYDNTTVEGEKKNIQGAWPPAYNPSVIEQSWYSWWESQKFFNPDHQKNIDENAPTFTILIPPPNVTGSLHIGHALTNAVQDAMVRYYRQSGYKTEWLSGTDHAGISCQVVVEKQLAKAGIKKADLGREKFVEKIWEWKAESGGKIMNQLKKLGSSLDWDREVFTLDQERTVCHDEAFCRLFERGLIYRDNRLVGWDCTLQTAISDVEIEYMDVDAPIQLQIGAQKYPFGYLWNFSYPVITGELEKLSDAELGKLFDENQSAFVDKLTFGTTRPETMIGDSALAIHPEDARYTQYHGKFVFHPIRRIRIPIVCDSVLVDMAFGTGVVKVTPAHDPNDFEVGKRHNLEFCNMLQPNGKCLSPGTQFHDVPRLDARIKIIQFFTQIKLYEGKTPNKMAIGLSQRSRDVIEPYMMPQWYVDCKSMAARGLEAVEKKELIITPSTHEQTWRNYLGNIRPWCISRQLWWGHQIPLYKVWIKGTQEPAGCEQKDWVCGRTVEEATANALKKLNCTLDQLEIKRDQDVTDTWFSSAMFPFSAFGWPKDTLDLKNFFPGAVLETGYDILFFWVARMVMVSLELFNKLPFKEVYLHAMVRDSKGEKMSKSKGNVIDPLDCINGITLAQLNAGLHKTNLSAAEIVAAEKLQKAEFPQGIAQCGTDALRMALSVYTGQGRAINLDVNKIIAQRNFCNKIFNSTKFALEFAQLDQQFIDSCGFASADEFITFAHNNPEKLSLNNKYILNQLAEFVHVYNKSIRMYNIAGAAEGCITFWWEQLCDQYVELVKPILLDKKADQLIIDQTKLTLFTCLDQALRMISIFMPFLCEEMFQRIPKWSSEKSLDTIMFAKMPRDCKYFNFGNYSEYTEYDTLCLNTESIWYKLRNNAVIKQGNEDFNMSKTFVSAGRSMKAQYGINGMKLKYFIQSQQTLSAEQLEQIKTLVYAESITIVNNEKPQNCGSIIVSPTQILYAELTGMIDFEKEIQKLEKEIENISQTKQRLDELMSGENYSRLPQKLRDENEVKMVGYIEKLKNCEELKQSYKGFL
ncbi:Valine-tRNA_ligase [Hexamita inflata]|uniref:valine--tRNA ligase n=1 Tax=Hexamita inflata TaxID=28002 RepID=A0AA86RTJ2_9EUKA|nr:Valine-tRNA ligase [Hexamita inflata]